MRERLVASWVVGKDGFPRITVVGEVDVSTAPLLDEALCDARATDPAFLTVSLEECTYFDSSGLGVLLRHARRMRNMIVVVREDSAIRRLLRVSRFDQTVTVLGAPRAA